MHVLELYDRDAATGVSRAVLTATAGLRRRGVRVTRLLGSTSLLEDQPIVSRHCLDSSGRGLVVLAALIRSVVADRGVTLVHAHQRRLALAAKLALTGTRIPVAEHVHSIFGDRRRTSFRSDLVLCLTATLRADLVRRYPHAQGRAEVCTNGVELPALSGYVPGTRHELRLLAMGRIEPEKSAPSFARLVEELRQQGLNVRGTWLGDGSLISQMRKHYSEFVEWPGLVKDVSPYILSSDCVVSLSQREALPFAVLDGMAAARPALVLGVGGLVDLVDSHVGICWDPQDRWERIVDDSLAFLSSRSRLTLAGREARARVAQGWSADKAVDCLVHEFQRVLSGA